MPIELSVLSHSNSFDSSSDAVPVAIDMSESFASIQELKALSDKVTSLENRIVKDLSHMKIQLATTMATTILLAIYLSFETFSRQI